jgi:hypothetical protein
MAFIFEDEQTQPQSMSSRFVFDDTPPTVQQAPPPAKQKKGILETATDVFTGAAARMAQGVNESLGAINKGFGLNATVFDEGAAHWNQVAEEAGSTGLPAQIYQGVGAAPAGVAEFIAGPVYAGAKGAAEGYREGGVPGALEKAAIETVKRVGIGKIFHGIENTAVSGMPKAAAMGGTMGVQTVAETAMTEEGIQPQDVAASAITGTLLSVSGSGKQEALRRNLIKEGVQPEVAKDLSGRVQEGNRFQFEDQPAATGPTELELATAYNRTKLKSSKSGLMQTPGVSNALFQERLLDQYRKDQEKFGGPLKTELPVQEAQTERILQDLPVRDANRFVFEDQTAPETARPPITVTDPQGRIIDAPFDTRPPESIGPLVSETGNGAVFTIMQPDTAKPGAVEQFTATAKKRGNQDVFAVRLNPSQRRTLEAVRQEISDGQAGQRVGIYNTNEPGSTDVSWGSSFPDYFQNKGYTKNQALRAIDNILNGEGVTANQRIMVEDMHQAKRQQDTNAILSDRAKPAEVSAMNLNKGDTLKRNGEQFKVLDVSPDGVTLKDGVVMELNHEQAINYDRGTLKDIDGKQKRIPAENGGSFDPFDFEARSVDAAAHEAATSPLNNLPEPTQAQIEAGNYKKGHVRTHGLDIAIENPEGSTRKGIDENGKPWETKLYHHYGYIKGVTGADKDHLDVFIGHDQRSNKIFVVDQVNPKTGVYDESKVMIGFGSTPAARDGYLINYDKSGSKRIGKITESTVDNFKQWLNTGNTKKPFTEFLVKETSIHETARQSAAETLNSVYPESSPDIGLAVKPGTKRDDIVTMPQPHTDKAGNFTFAEPQVETRWKAANGLSDGPNFLERTKSFMHKMLSETRHFPELDDSSFAGKRTADILRRFESSAVAAKAKTAEHLHGLTATFGPKKMDIFTRKVILDDLMNEADKGRGLPFGYTPESLQNDHAAVSKIVDTHTDIKAAVKRRADVNKALVMDLVENDLLPIESVLKPEALTHFQKTGKYSSDDINTHYFRHQVLEYANARRWAGISTAGDVRNKQRGWQKGRQGSELDINTNFLEAEFEVFSQGLKELATKKTLDEVLTLNDMVPELKAQAKKEGVKEWKDLIPEGHVIWQPEKGSMFYRGQTMPEQIVAKFISENPHFADIAKKFKEVTILGGKKTEVVIPSGLAKTLDSLRTDRETATLDTVNQKMLGAWKIWTLLSPRRAIKYNLNNMSSDFDAAVAADPAIIIKHFNTAWKNAWNRRAGRAMTKDEIDMLDRGVIDSGISINEIPDINKLPCFSRLSETDRQQKLIDALRSGDLSKLAPPNIIAKYFHWVSGLSQLREGLLREAAYMRAKELLEQGKKVYWASKPSEIEALPDIKDKAAKLSRELLLDYGNLSAHGEKIRARFIPFWSFLELNLPRYYRLFQNAAARGEGGSTAARMAGVGGRKIAGATLGVAEKVLLTQVLFASVTAFNHLVHPEEEEQLSVADQKQLHVIIGTKADGKIMTARFQGAFSDALSWFGLEDYPQTISKLRDGEMEPGELAKKMLMATPNKIANAAAPFFKLGGELITGKSIYPDIAKPRPIRDKIEHAARFLSLDNEYKALTGKPARGYLDSLKGLYLYENDPGEVAYNDIRRTAAKYLERNGKEPVSGEPTARSNALYYYKQALRFEDETAVEKYREEYIAAGGTRAGIQKSISKAHPMAMLPLNQRTKFRQSLSAEDLETLTRGIEWYHQVYTP